MANPGGVCVVIPALNPDENLEKTVAGLRAVGFAEFVIVDDGSDETHLRFFPSPEEPGITLLHNKVNRGKGESLRRAFRFIKKHAAPYAEGVVTVDADGQHRPDDVAAVAKLIPVDGEPAAVLGCRDFNGKDVPKKSRFGNKITKLAFRLLCGMKLSDTQTGLRGFSISLLPMLIETAGDRYEYETNMLIKFKQNRVPVKETTIQTVYIEENKASHFRPIADSIRIYGFILMYALSSFLSSGIDMLLFFILRSTLFPVLGTKTILVATVAARAVSSFTNFMINRNRVFRSSGSVGKTLLRYYTLAIPQMLVSAGSVQLISHFIGGTSGVDTLIKVFVDIILFFVGYRIQQGWVFAAPVKHEKADRVKEPLTPWKVIRRILLVLLSTLLAVVITVYSSLFLVANGPSETIRNSLVLSAKQASATKWVPSLFLPKKTVDKIVEDSKKTVVQTVEPARPPEEPGETDEWADAKDGMKLAFISKPKFKAYLLTVKDPARVSVGVSSDNFTNAKAGQNIFQIAQKYNAVAALNGGEFSDPGGVGTGAKPSGLTYSGGKRVWSDGLKRTTIGFDKNNTLICREGMTAAEADGLGIRDAVSFQNGNVLIDKSDGKVRAHYSDNNTGAAQRTAIAQREDGAVLMLVTDGRTASSIGATRDDVIELLLEYGAVTAGMLDGGSSTMLYRRNYFDIYNVDKSTLDTYQKQGLVNRYKAFTPPRRIPTFFIVTGE